MTEFDISINFLQIDSSFPELLFQDNRLNREFANQYTFSNYPGNRLFLEKQGKAWKIGGDATLSRRLFGEGKEMSLSWNKIKFHISECFVSIFWSKKLVTSLPLLINSVLSVFFHFVGRSTRQLGFILQYTPTIAVLCVNVGNYFKKSSIS